MSFHNNLRLFFWLLLVLFSDASVEAQLAFNPSGEPVEAAPSSFGNKAIRMVTNASDQPVIAFGSNGHLYVSMWNAAAATFAEPLEIDAESNVFMSDAEGPRMACQGDYIILTYQISGEWANGARSVHSMDGGLSWSDPVAMVSEAAVDHFMPCVAVDGDGNPFAGVKVGNSTASIYEGILRSSDAGNSWMPAVDASANADGNSVCECCPSQPFWKNGRYYDLVRNNNENIRDFWLMSSADGDIWDAAIDIDPLDWEINACPESGPAVTGPVQGSEFIAAFMSGGGSSGQSRVYVSSFDLAANSGHGEWLSVEPITVSQFENATQNTPVLAQWQDEDGSAIIALAWEQNSGGYDVQLTLSHGDNWSLTDAAQNITGAWSGQHRKPAIAFSTDTDGNPRLHLAWQQSSSATVQYLSGTIVSPTGTACLVRPEPVVFSDNQGITIEPNGHWDGSAWNLWTVEGRLLQSGIVRTGKSLRFTSSQLPPRFLFSIEKLDGTRWAQQIMKP